MEVLMLKITSAIAVFSVAVDAGDQITLQKDGL
jgi:hypothetical protein